MAVAGLFGAVRVGIDHDLVGSPVPKGGMHGVELHDLLVRPAEPAVNTAQVDRHGRHPALLPECQPPGTRRRTDGRRRPGRCYRSRLDQSSGLSSTKWSPTSPVMPSTSTRPRLAGGSSAEYRRIRHVGREIRPRQLSWADACPTGKPTARVAATSAPVSSTLSVTPEARW